ncbi:hypothetical protein PPERSA_12944 [Pseudocohnilembus persalinus]|uniref:Uncharacterized protein n=1 Tax=Pseudocohnilembus persalinus TaxID=266149 RepID=A0A0V0R1R2_PSEPJ|nr:hypothetical protein PPERSA_12944 [Pseudocohnilembus persalinus]|eukprot:KRX08463.1 hypothetical protein PPERSA_12944 [Pseudocohnilembus persalinus]
MFNLDSPLQKFQKLRSQNIQQQEIIENAELKKTRNINKSIGLYLDNFDTRLDFSREKCISEADSRTFSQKSQLIRLEKKVIDLQKKYDMMDEVVNNSEFVKQDKEKLRILENYSKKLVDDFQSLANQIQESQFSVRSYKKEIIAKQNTIRLINQEAMVLKAQLEHNQKLIKRYQLYLKIKQNNNQSLINEQKDDTMKVDSELQYYKNIGLNSQKSQQLNQKQNSRYHSQNLPKIKISKNSIQNQLYTHDSQQDSIIGDLSNTQIQQESNNFITQPQTTTAKISEGKSRLVNNNLGTNKNKNNYNYMGRNQSMYNLQQKVDTDFQVLDPEQQLKLKKLNDQIKKIKAINQKTVNAVRKKGTQFQEFKNLVEECFDQYKKKILKIPQKDIYDQIKQKTNNKGESNNRLVIYDTLKQFILKQLTNEQKKEKLHESINNMHLVPYDIFRLFSVQQLINLIYINPEIAEQIFQTINLKSKAINLLQLRLKASTFYKENNSFSNSRFYQFNQTSLNNSNNQTQLYF